MLTSSIRHDLEDWLVDLSFAAFLCILSAEAIGSNGMNLPSSLSCQLAAADP
jgi:hypothetical protein